MQPKQPTQPQEVPSARPAEGYARPAPPTAPHPGQMPPRRRGMPAWGIAMIIAGGVVLTLGIAALILIPVLGYATFNANKGMCAQHLALINTANQVLANTPNGPIGDQWCEGRALDPATKRFTAEPADAIQKCRLAFWRLVADSDIHRLGVSVGGPTIFHCPGATRGTKSIPPLGTMTAPAPDFNDPINQLYYSMTLQMPRGTNIPTYGTNQPFVIAGDRSPASDGLPCIAGQNSANHTWGSECTGQNVLFSAGNVKFLATSNVGIGGDEIYLVGNTDGAPTGSSVPVNDNDTVLMPVVAGS